MPDSQDTNDSPQHRKAALAIVRTLQQAGYTAYFAGGCVRDELLGIEPHDYDVATDARPETITSLFRATSSVGAHFGVVLVHDQGIATEVATFRADGPYSDRRRPDAIDYADPEHDARRRDFTINALFLDPIATADAPSIHGHVIDFVGGVADLKAGLVRAVGTPDDRLAEDHLRALRAVRFAARFGFDIEEQTARAIATHSRDLAGVSCERIGDEIRRMLMHPSRAAAASMIESLGLDEVVLGSHHTPTAACASLAHLPEQIDPALGLGAWALDRQEITSAAQVPALVRRWRKTLCLSNDERDRLREVLDLVFVLEDDWPSLSVPAQKRHAAARSFPDALALVAARDVGRADPLAVAIQNRVAQLRNDGIGLTPEPILDGNDIIGLGVTPGPGFARWLRMLYDAQLDGRVSDRKQAEAFVRELVRSHRV